MKGRKVLYGIGVLGGLLGVGLLIKHLLKKEKTSPNKDTNENIEPKETTYHPSKETPIKKKPIPKNDAFPLVKGSKGKRVERLQIYLLRTYGKRGAITGIFDQSTLETVQRFLKTDKIDKEKFKQLNMGVPIYEKRKT